MDNRKNPILKMDLFEDEEARLRLQPKLQDVFDKALRLPLPQCTHQTQAELASLWNRYVKLGIIPCCMRPKAPQITFRDEGPFGVHFNKKYKEYRHFMRLPPSEFIFPPPGPFPLAKMYPNYVPPAPEDNSASDERSKLIQESNSNLLNEMNDDVIYLMLYPFTLRQKLSLRLICKRIQASIDTNITLRKSSLKLFSHRYDVVNYWKQVTLYNMESVEHLKFRDFPNDDDIVLNTDSLESCQFAGQLFGQAESLVVFFGESSKFQYLYEILNYMPNLKKLTLLGELTLRDSRLNYNQKFASKLSESICSLTNLTHLDLLVKNLFGLVNPRQAIAARQENIILSIEQVMPQLEVFSLNGPIDNLTNLVSNLGPKCTQLKLDATKLTASKLETIVRTNPALKGTIQELKVYYLMKGTMSVIGRQLQGIRSLELKSAVFNFSDILIDIARLPHLTELCLDGFFGLSSLEEKFIETLHIYQPLYLSVNLKMPQIKRLSIESIHSFRGHSLSTIFQRIGNMFPSIESLNLGHWKAISGEEISLCLDIFEHLTEFRLFFIGKLQAHLIAKHLEPELDKTQLAKPYLFRKQANKWIMEEKGFCPAVKERSPVHYF